MKTPPKIAYWILSITNRWNNREIILGDFEEFYYDVYKDSGAAAANLWFYKQSIKSIPRFLMTSFYWGLVMSRSYLIIALRNLYKNKLYAFINIIGLGLAIGCGILAYFNYQFANSFDSFHENANSIYRINSYKIVNNNRENWAYAPLPLTLAMEENIPGIERSARFYQSTGILKYGEKVFFENIFFADDEEFFEMFTFPLKYGSKEMLKNKNGIVINEEIAIKYFGNINPVGEVITVVAGNEKKRDFLIKGVIKKIPQNSALSYLSIFLPIESIKEMLDIDPTDWKNYSYTSFIQTK